MQGFIDSAIDKLDTVQVDVWYESAYELYMAGWDLKDFGLMSHIFSKKEGVKVNFQPRTLFRNGKDWT